MRMLMVLAGYLSTATVLAAALGFGYLWQTQRLDDEKVFRIIALVHDVDIDGFEADQEEQQQEVPGEEPSLQDIENYRAVFDRNTEMKLDALKRGAQEFDHKYNQLRGETDRFEEVALKIGKELERQSELASQEAVAKVVEHLEAIKEAAAKDQLMKILAEPDGYKDVILLMNAMSLNKLGKILKQFKSEDEKNALHEIHKVMLEGGPRKALIDKARGELDSLGPGR